MSFPQQAGVLQRPLPPVPPLPQALNEGHVPAGYGHRLRTVL